MVGGLVDYEDDEAIDLVLVIVLGRDAEQRRRRTGHGVGERQIELDAFRLRIGVDQPWSEHVSADVEGEANGAVGFERGFGEADAEDGGGALDDGAVEGLERGDLRVVVAHSDLGAVDVDGVHCQSSLSGSTLLFLVLAEEKPHQTIVGAPRAAVAL